MRLSSVYVLALGLLVSIHLTSQGAAQERGLANGEVLLQPGDILRVQIWREPDLSGDFNVDVDGTVILPLLGTKQVSRIPMSAIRDDLLGDYRVHLRNPAITITPLRRINVLGEVQKPGLYPVDPTVSLAGVIATAEGATPMGDLGRIRILRADEAIHKRVGQGRTLQDLDLRSGDQIIVGRRSWFERNTPLIVSTLISVTSIVVTLITTSK